MKINTANRTLGYLRHTFKHIDSEVFLLLYKSLVRPHLEFSSCIWSPHQKYNKDSIERVQRRATKMIPWLKDLPYEDRLRKLNLETLAYRRNRADLLETYRILNNIHIIDGDCHCLKCPQKHMFMPSLGITTRSNTRKLQIQEATGVRKHYFSSRTTDNWNNLSEKTVTSDTINSFKNNLKNEIGGEMYSYKFSY